MRERIAREFSTAYVTGLVTMHERDARRTCRDGPLESFGDRVRSLDGVRGVVEARDDLRTRRAGKRQQQPEGRIVFDDSLQDLAEVFDPGLDAHRIEQMRRGVDRCVPSVEVSTAVSVMSYFAAAARRVSQAPRTPSSRPLC